MLFCLWTDFKNQHQMATVLNQTHLISQKYHRTEEERVREREKEVKEGANRRKFVLYRCFSLSHMFVSLCACVTMKARLDRWCHSQTEEQQGLPVPVTSEAQECLWYRGPIVALIWSEFSKNQQPKKQTDWLLDGWRNEDKQTNLVTCTENTLYLAVELLQLD